MGGEGHTVFKVAAYVLFFGSFFCWHTPTPTKVLEKRLLWLLLLGSHCLLSYTLHGVMKQASSDVLVHGRRQFPWMYLILWGLAHLVNPSRKLVCADYTNGRWVGNFLRMDHELLSENNILFIRECLEGPGETIWKISSFCAVGLTQDKNIFLRYRVCPRKSVLHRRQRL